MSNIARCCQTIHVIPIKRICCTDSVHKLITQLCCHKDCGLHPKLSNSDSNKVASNHKNCSVADKLLWNCSKNCANHPRPPRSTKLLAIDCASAVQLCLGKKTRSMFHYISDHVLFVLSLLRFTQNHSFLSLLFVFLFVLSSYSLQFFVTRLKLIILLPALSSVLRSRSFTW